MPIQTRQFSLPLNRRSRGRAVTVPEKDVERNVDFALARRQFPFLNTTVRYAHFDVTCPRCKLVHKVRQTGGTGQDKGIADRLLYSVRWWHPLLPASLWLSLELKGSKTPFSSPEQKRLHEAGHTVLARGANGPDQAVQAAEQVDQFFGYIEDLEQAANGLLDALRVKGQDWRTKARELSTVLRLAGESEAAHQS